MWPVRSDPAPPQQARSRQTLSRLLSATVTLLAERGLTGVTIPEVATAAGLATGSVYRRFADKDALLRAAFLQFVESAHQTSEAALPPQRFAGLTLENALTVIAQALVHQYRGKTNLLRALDQYLDQQTDSDFERRALEGTAANVRLIIRALLPFRQEIRHAEPEEALKFALLSAMTIIEAHKLHKPLLWKKMMPLDDESLATEAAKAMAAYLICPGGR